MFFINYYGDIEYIESDNSDIRVVYNHTEMYRVKEEELEDGGYYFTYTNDTEIMEMFRTIIQDINNKKIIDYSYNEIKIYTTKENIELLKNNLNNYFHDEEEKEQIINAYEETISELNRQLEEKDNVIYELENNCNTE